MVRQAVSHPTDNQQLSSGSCDRLRTIGLAWDESAVGRRLDPAGAPILLRRIGQCGQVGRCGTAARWLHRAHAGRTVGAEWAAGRGGRHEVGGSRPISRVLSWATIHLGRASPRASSDLPGSPCGPQVRGRSRRASLFGLAPGGVCRAAECCHRRGALLPHRFTLTVSALLRRLGGLLSVALSVGSRPPGVTWHLALWSPDFPLQH